MSWRDRGGLYGLPHEREDRDWTDIVQVCENGHQITSMAASGAEPPKKAVPEVRRGHADRLPKCGTRIPGYTTSLGW